MDELRRRALRCLARREYTRLGLARKLASHGRPEQIDALLDELERQGLLSDARAAEAYLRARAHRYGRAYLARALAEKGIAPSLIAEKLAEVLGNDELSVARALLRKKFAAPPRNAQEWARQARFLAARGFSSELIHRLLREPCDP
ncbi:MAG: RecX family transcriptional regulator [Rhodocyclaceae bacterium]|nr:RecX family transcriptional regulator [Rhodocyclaceae bacterium]